MPLFKNQVCSLYCKLISTVTYCNHGNIYPHFRKGNIRRTITMSNSINFSGLSVYDINWSTHYFIFIIEIPIEVLGILMNLSGIMVLLLKQKTHNSIFHKLIIFLGIWDLSYLTFSLMTSIVFFQNPNLSYALNKYAYPVQFTLLTGSIYSTIAITLDRYLHTYIQRVLT